MALTSVRIKQELDDSLKKMAAKIQRSKSWIINEALAEYMIRDSQESQKWLDTLEGLDSIRNGDVIEGEKVFDWMQSWGSDEEIDPPQINK